jgi:uncharacterized protein YgfB (UPF0149 family)
MGDRIQALIFLWNHHTKLGLGYQRTGELEASKIEGNEATRAFETIQRLAYPDSEAKEAQPEKYASHRPSCPTDDPKQY